MLTISNTIRNNSFIASILFKLSPAVALGFLIVVLFCIGTTESKAQNMDWHPVYDNFTTKDGLPTMEFYYSFQDDQGYMWFAGDRGVVRYNGSEFKTFTMNDGLTTNTVFKIDQDEKGRVWFMGDNPRLCYYKDGEIKQYKFNDNYCKLYPEAWRIQSYTSWRFKNDEIIICTSEHGAIEIDAKGNAQVIANEDTYRNNLFEYKGLVVNSKRLLDGCLMGYSTENIHHDLDSIGTSLLKVGRVNEELHFFSGSATLVLLDKMNFKRHVFKYSPIVTKTIDGKIWIGTIGDGLTVYRVEGLDLIEEDHFFENAIITNVFKSKEGHYWVCSISKGIFRIKDLNIEKAIGNDEAGVPSLKLGYHDGFLLFKNEGGNLQTLNVNDSTISLEKFKMGTEGVFIKSNASKDIFPIRSTLSYSLVIDNQDLSGETEVVADKRFNSLKSDLKFSTRMIAAFSGRYLLCGKNFIYDSLWQTITHVNYDIRNIVHADSSTFWVMSFSNLMLADTQHKKSWYPKNSLLQQRINSIQKIDDVTYFGTQGNGILVKKGNRVERLAASYGIIQDYVNNMETCRSNSLWVSANNGLSHIVLGLNNEVFAQQYKVSELDCEKINDMDASPKYVYLATNNGLRRIVNGTSVRKIRLPKLYIGSIVSGNQSLPVKEFKLDHTQRSLVVLFDVVSFEDSPALVRYRTHPDEDWIEVKESSIRLELAIIGQYTFEIQASVDGENWTTSESFSFELLPPFWRTWWFILICFALGTLLIWQLVRYRLNVVNRNHGKEQKMLQLQQKMLELQQEALTQQMNPHFIFNALGSVQNSILKGNSIQANSYLVKFSRLLRSGLNASRSQLIALEEDQELMINYLTVEKTRLGDQFSFDVQLELKSKSYSLFTAPFLLQPFIENAIKHGIGEHHKAGHILIIYKENEGHIECSIEDNGIGRVAASSKQIDGHISHGSDIAFQRIELFNKSKGVRAVKRTQDLYDLDNNSLGTKVIFTIPIIRK